MRMKRLLFVLMAIIMVFTFGVLGCTPADSGSTPPTPPGPVGPGTGGGEEPDTPVIKVPWIKISNTSLTLDQYDEFQLTTTTGNTEKAVVWSSNLPNIVSVDDTGYIIAKNPGNAIITAKAGTDADDPIATCQVRVMNNPGAMATLGIYPDVISVAKNGQYTLAVKPMFNGKEIADAATLDTIEYTWNLAGEETALANQYVSAEQSATKKNEITFTGLDYGSATYYVSALIRGANVMETVVVTCNNADYNFKIEGGDLTSGAGAFVGTLSGIGSTLTPVVKAYTKQGTEAGVATPNWVSDNTEVVTVSGQTITATGFGTATIVGTFAETQYKGVAVAIKITVSRPQGQLTEAFTFETGKTTFRAPAGLDGEITDIKYGGVSYFVSASGRNVTLSDDIKKLTHTDLLNEENELVIETSVQNYVASNAKVVTLEFNDAAELDMFWDAALSADYGPNAYGGYFTLGNNIAYNKNWISKWNWGDLNISDGNGETELQTVYGKTGNTSTCWQVATGGFAGIFDGQGYIIDGLTPSGPSGIFGGISRDGIIRNIGFTNGGLGGDIHSFITQHTWGEMTNLYVGVKDMGWVETNNNKNGILAGCIAFGSAKVNNCFVDLHGKKASVPASTTAWGSTNVLGLFHEGYGSLNNVLTVTQGMNAWSNVSTTNGTGATNVVKAYNTRSAMASATDWKTIYDNSWDKNYWTLDKQGLPIMKSMDIGAIGLSQSVAAPGSQVTLRIAGAANGIVSSWTATGLTVSGGKVTIPSTAAKGTTYTVTAKTTHYGDYTFTLTVGEGQSFDGGKRVVGVYGKNTLDIALNAGMSGVTITSVTIAGTEVTDFEYSNNKIILGKNEFQNLDATDGYREVIVVADKGGAAYTETFSMRFVTMAIATADDLDAWRDAAKAKGTESSWAGTFVLVNDITYNANVFAQNARIYSHGSSPDVNDTPTDTRQGYGFGGLFDGQGYTIDGLYVGASASGTRSSFFGPIASNGVVQNVSFINGRAANGTFFLSNNTTAGTMKNIYAHIALGATADTILGGGNFGVATFENIIVEFDGASSNKALFTWANTGYGVKHVYIIGKGAKLYNGANTSKGPDTDVAAYESWAAFNTANPASAYASNWTNDFWKMNGNYPVPKALTARTLDFGDSLTSTAGGATYNFDVKNDYYTTFANNKGYAMANGVVTAPTQAFTITGTSLISGASNGSLSVDVLAGQTATLSAPVKTYINDDTTAEFTVDFSSVIAGIKGASQTVELRANSVKFAGASIANYENNGFVFTLNENNLYDADGVKVNSGKHPFEFIVDIKEGGDTVKIVNCSADVIVVTKVIKTAEDFMAMYTDYFVKDYKALGTQAAGNLETFGGYYELGNNINLAGKEIHSYHNWFNGIAMWNSTGGFQGTFDGCGYAVDGLTLTQYTGIFGGIISTTGVVKNVAFTNVTAKTTNALLAQNIYGTVENVYVHLKKMNSGTKVNGSGAIAMVVRGTDYKIKNVVVDIDALNYTVGSLGTTDDGQYSDNYTNAVGRIEETATISANVRNVLAITQGEAVYQTGDTKTSATNGDVMTDTANNVYGFNTRTLAINGKAQLATMIAELDTTYWTTDANGLPVFKSIKDIPADAELVNKYAVYGTPVTLSLTKGNATVGTWSTTASNVTISGNQITINAGAPSSVPVTLTSRFGGTKTFTITVTAQKNLNLGTVKTELADSNGYVEFDFNALLDTELTAGQTLSIEKDTLKYDSTVISTYTYEDGVLKIAENVFKAANGKQLSGKTAISFTAAIMEGGVSVGIASGSAELLLITKILRTEEDVLNWHSLAEQDYVAETYIAQDDKGVDIGTFNGKSGGYFELGNNIHMSAAYPQIFPWRYNVGNYWTAAGGFHGTFDGCGYVIDNIKFGNSMTGFFGGNVGSGAVIKNLGFTNVTLADRHNVLGQNLNGGKVENVFIHAKVMGQGSHPNGASAAFYAVSSNATVNNVVAKVDSLTYTADSLTQTGISYTNVLGYVNVGSSLTNAIAITAGESVYYDVNVAGLDAANANVSAEVMIKGSVYGYDTYEQAVANKSAYASVANTLVATGMFALNNDGLPVIKSLQYPASADIASHTVVIGGSLELALSDEFFSGITTSWSTSTSGATVSGNTVSVNSAMPVDSTITVTATNAYGFSKSFTLTAIEATQVTGAAQKLEKGRATQTLAIAAEGTVQSVLISGVAINDYEYTAGAGLTLSKEAIASVPFGAGTMQVLTKNGNDYTETTMPIEVATMFISDKADLLEFSTLTRGNTWGVSELYVVDADIDMQGAEYSINVNTNGANNVTGAGFAGTFDGRNHVIKNIVITGNGFISGIRQDGVLKNIAFLNATQKSQGFIATTTHGSTIENVYAQVTSEFSGNAAFLGQDNYAGKAFKNIVVDVTGKVGNYYLLYHHYNRNYNTLKDVYLVGGDGITAGTTSNPSSGIDVVQVFSDYAAFKAGGNDTEGVAITYTDMDNDFWNIVNGAPAPAMIATNATPAITNTEVSNLAVKNFTLAVQDNIPFVTIKLASAVDGVSVLGRKVNVSAAAAGKSFTVVVTNPVTGASVSKTFAVRAVNEVALTGAIDLDLGGGSSVSADMTNAFTTYEITTPATQVGGVVIGSQDIPYTIDGNKIVYESSMLNMETLLGEQTLRISVTNENGDMYDLLQPVIVISKVLMTKDDAVNMLNYAIHLDANAEGPVTGYFVLGADIDAQNGQVGIGYWGNAAVNTVHDGTFDGRGFTISNVKYSQNASGIFGSSKNCTFKNIIMRNVDVAHAGASVLSEAAGGNVVVSNVFVEGKFTGGTPADWGEQSLLLGKTSQMSSLVMTNAYTVVTSTNYTDVSFAGTHFGERVVVSGSFVNCVGLDLSGKGLRLAFDGNTFTNSQVVTTKSAAAALTGHSGTAWNAFKAYCQA